MKYLFKQAVVLKGKSFPRGVNEVAESLESDPHFLKFVGAGFIHDLEASNEVSTLSPKEKADAFLNKVMGKKKEKAVEIAPSSEKEEVAPEEEMNEDDDSHDEGLDLDAPHKGKKKSKKF